MIAPALFRSLESQTFDLQSLAQLYSARILNCTAEGIGITLLAWILLRALGRQNSGTRFAVWFSALLGIAVLPLVGHFGSKGAEMAQRSEITMPGSWAVYIFSGWLLMAAAGLVRIALGFWRLRQLRRSCVPIEAAALDPRLRKTLEEFDSPRPVTVCVSDHLRVPTAVGFIKPLRRNLRSNARWRAMTWCWPRPRVREPTRSAWFPWPRKACCGGDWRWRRPRWAGCGTSRSE